MKKIDGDKLIAGFMNMVNIIIILVMAAVLLAILFGFGLFVYDRYEVHKHKSLKFAIETTYIKDGYSYSDKKSECVMYDPNTTNAIEVIKSFKKSHFVEKQDGLKQEVSVTDDCIWLWMPKAEEIYR
ncbi:hypothetical protein [Psychrobacter sp. PG1]|uniref:hypothetical protein n=1 Tax=unclassified Psychrobacter TaxID=196806 RepID=UPI001865E5B4|nr:hypothetical protein [Psychrobacter sp. PG1]